MEPEEYPNQPSPQEYAPNPKPQSTSINMEIDVGLRSLRIVIQELQNTKDPSRLSLATSLDTIVSIIVNA
jgi:hypothetical protein